MPGFVLFQLRCHLLARRLNPGWILLGVGLSHCFHDKKLDKIKHPSQTPFSSKPVCTASVLGLPRRVRPFVTLPQKLPNGALHGPPAWVPSACHPSSTSYRSPGGCPGAPCLHLPAGCPGRLHTRREVTRREALGRKDRATYMLASSTWTLPPSSTDRLCLPATSAGGCRREPGTSSSSVLLLLSSYTIDDS